MAFEAQDQNILGLKQLCFAGNNAPMPEVVCTNLACRVEWIGKEMNYA